MNKNTIIGVLIAVVVLGGGYFLLKTPAAPVVVDQTPTTPGTQTPPATDPVVETPPVTVTPGVPMVITNTNTSTSNSTAIVTGQIKPNGAATTYWFDYGTTTAFGTSSSAQAVGSGYNMISTPAYITGLKASTTYYFRLSAKNSFGTVNGSTYTFTTNTNPPPQGTIPAARTSAATNIARTAANVGGQVTPNGAATNYWFEYGTTASFGAITSIETTASTTAATNASASLTGLQPLTKYYFRLNAQNQFGTVLGSTLTFTTSGPAAAQQPTVDTTSASNVTSTAARFNGRINPNSAETTYWFEYSNNSLLATLIGNGTPQQTLASGNNTTSVSANISGLTKNSTYYYRLVARNSLGTIRGDIESFKTKQ